MQNSQYFAFILSSHINVTSRVSIFNRQKFSSERYSPVGMKNPENASNLPKKPSTEACSGNISSSTTVLIMRFSDQIKVGCMGSLWSIEFDPAFIVWIISSASKIWQVTVDESCKNKKIEYVKGFEILTWDAWKIVFEVATKLTWGHILVHRYYKLGTFSRKVNEDFQVSRFPICTWDFEFELETFPSKLNWDFEIFNLPYP